MWTNPPHLTSFAKSAAAIRSESAMPLRSIVLPAARDRWVSQSVRAFTPDRIEAVIRGAYCGDLEAQWQLFDLMEATWPRLLKNLSELKGAVLGLDWNVMPWARKGEKPSSEAQRRAQLLEDAIWSMDPRPELFENDFEDTIGDILDAWGKGLAVLEVDWASRLFEGANLIVPRCTRWVQPRYYGFASDSGALQFNWSQVAADGGPSMQRPSSQLGPFPPEKFLIAAPRHKSGPPIGNALLRALGFWWAASNFTAEWFLNFAQVFGQPIRWATYDPSQPDLLPIITEALEHMGNTAWAAFPQGTAFELKEAAKGAGDNPHAKIIEVADRVCDILILRQTLTTDAGDKGTQALGMVHESIRGDAINDAAGFAARVVNRQLITAWSRLNFGDTAECPFTLPSPKLVKDAKALAARDEVLLRNGMRMPKAWFYERHNIPMPSAGEAVIVGRAPTIAL